MKNLQIDITNQNLFYEIDKDNFGLNFPTGIDAGELAEKLKEANGKS